MNVVIVGVHVATWAWLWWRRQKGRRFETSDQELIEASEANKHPYNTIHRLSTSLPNLNSTPVLPEPLDSTPCHLIDDAVQLAAVAARLASSPRLALDIEHHSTHTYYGQSCTIQLSNGHEDFIIDAVALKSRIPSTLGPLFTDPNILKIVHGGGSDALWLLRDFGIRLINIFDTEKCCQVLGYPPGSRSLKFLLNKFVPDVQVDKSLQMADWRQRPLSKELVDYARSDVHWLLYIADCLGKELGFSDGGGGDGSQIIQDTESLLGRAVHRSQALSLVEYSPPLPRVAASAAAAGIMKTYISTLRLRGPQEATPLAPTSENEPATILAAPNTTNGVLIPPPTPFDEDQINQITDIGVRVHALCLWRDGEGRKIDEGVTCVLPDDVVVTLAEHHYNKNIQTNADLESFLEQYSKNNKSKNDISTKYANACKFPEIALQEISPLLKELHAAGAGHRPWARPDVLAALKPPSPLDTAAKRRHEDPELFKEKLGERFGVKKKVYENCKMLSKSGDLLCFTDRKRLLWYIRKGLAEEVDPGNEGLTVKLLFDHKDDDQRAGTHEFYSSKRTNTCVACGSGKHYLRYRVVPVCYRRALPSKFKSHRSHDVLLLCVGCHEIAQRASEQMKREISNEYGIPLFPRIAVNAAGAAGPAGAEGPNKEENGTEDEMKPTVNGNGNGNGNCDSNLPTTELIHPFSVRKAAIALEKDAPNLPASRREELQLAVSAYVRTVEPWLQDVPPDAPFSQDDLWAGLLSGMSKSTRRKVIRRWIADGHEEKLPLALIEEMNTSGTEGCNSGVDIRDGIGHSWHGQKVIETVIEQGGDAAVSALCARFRKAFIDALQPKYLPAGWRVDHAAPRTFGEHSIYTTSSSTNSSGGRESGTVHENGNENGVEKLIDEEQEGDGIDEEEEDSIMQELLN